MIQEIFNYFLISSISIGFVFISSTLLSKRGKDKSLIYLNLIVVFLTLNYLQIVLLDNVFKDANFFIKTLRIPFYAFILPAFYTFVTYYLNVESKTKSYVFLSSLLFLIEIIVRVVMYKLYYDDNENYVVAKYRQIEEIVNIIFSLFLFGKAFVLLFVQTKLYQHILTFDTIKWLKKFMLIGCFIMLAWIFAVIFNLNKVLHPNVYVYFPLRFSVSILIFWLSFEAYFNYNLVSERIQLRKAIQKDKDKKQKDFTSINTSINEKFRIIKDHIEGNRSYLNSNFGLEDLSKELKMSVSSLSQTINTESNYNFSDYINSLRVEKAKEFLNNEEYKNYTILSIGLECGFNSKSTFYLAFKKFTNQTPTEFRKKNK